MANDSTTTTGPAVGGGPAGVALALSAVLSVLAMWHHPSVGADGAAEAVAELSRMAGTAGAVHGALIALLLLAVFGFWGFAERLGLGGAGARGGLVAYVAGAAAMTGAALISGFLIPRLAGRYAGRSPEELELARQLVAFGHDANQVLAQAGVVAMSAAILFWSAALVRRVGAGRWVGWLGVLVGAVPILGFLTVHLRLDVHGMGAVVLIQAVWTLAAAGLLLTRRL